jgi:hypothetical protein
MSVFTHPARFRSVEVSIKVPVSVIPGSEFVETQGACILGERAADILAPLTHVPGFIGFKTDITGDLMALLQGPNAHLLYDNVTRDGVAEIGVLGTVGGTFINWNRKVYVMNDESGQSEVVFEIPFGAEVWVCEYVTKATCGSLMTAFYTHDPSELNEG